MTVAESTISIPQHTRFEIPMQTASDFHREYKIGLRRKPPIDSDLRNFAEDELNGIATDAVEFIPGCSVLGTERPVIRFVTGAGRWCKLFLPVFVEEKKVLDVEIYAEGEEDVDDADMLHTLSNILLILHAEVYSDKVV